MIFPMGQNPGYLKIALAVSGRPLIRRPLIRIGLVSLAVLARRLGDDDPRGPEEPVADRLAGLNFGDDGARGVFAGFELREGFVLRRAEGGSHRGHALDADAS